MLPISRRRIGAFQGAHSERRETVIDMMGAETLRPRFRLPLPEAIFAAISVAMVAAFAITLGLRATDGRIIGDVSVWAKPLKFELALALHAGTLSLVAARLSRPFRTGVFMQAVALAFLAACAIEMGWIIAHAAQGQQSHFNDSTAFHRAMFSVMAFCAVIITGAAGAVALAVWCDRGFAATGTVRTGIIVGLAGGTILTMVTAFAIGGLGGPYVGGVPDIASRMMFTGWSLSGGDLRVAHFLATHMVQAIPVAALFAVAARLGRMTTPLLWSFAVLWTGWVLLEFQTALSGETAIILDLIG